MTGVALKLESSVDSAPAVLLHDSSATPLTSLAAGQRELLPLQLDITETGTHTLACSAVYTGEQQRSHMQCPAHQASPIQQLPHSLRTT